MVRDLIAARLQEEPNAFSNQSIIEKWFSNPITRTTTPLGPLLIVLATRFQKFRDVYCGYQDSEPVFDSEQTLSPELQFIKLRNLAIEFVDPESLRVAAQKVAAGKRIVWDDLARWDSLATIREILDQLPEPATQLRGPSDTKVENCQVIPPDILHVGKRKWQGLSESHFKLLESLLTVENYTAPKEDVMDWIWQQDDPDRTSNALKSSLRRLRKWFFDKGVPLTVRQVKGFVVIEGLGDSPPKPKKAGDKRKKGPRK
jgi:hypothetical protein